MAAVDYFLKIDGVDGESQDTKHKGEIQLLSWTWAASTPVMGGQAAGKMRTDDLVCWMNVNRASVLLMSNMARNRRMANVVLTCRKAGKEQQDFYKIKMKDVIISNFTSEAGKSGNEVVPIDRFSLNYSEIEFEYREQRQDGTLGGAVTTVIKLRDRE